MSHTMPRVRDLMTTQVKTIPPDLDTAAARQLMRSAPTHHLLVVEGGHLVGVLSQRDLGGSRDEALPTGPVSRVMCSRVVVIGPEVSVRTAATLLCEHDIGCLPVVDGKQLTGILTTNHVLAWIARDGDSPESEPRPKSRKPPAQSI